MRMSWLTSGPPRPRARERVAAAHGLKSMKVVEMTYKYGTDGQGQEKTLRLGVETLESDDGD